MRGRYSFNAKKIQMIDNLKSKARPNVFNLCIFFFFLFLTANGQSFQDHFKAAVSAYESGQYVKMLEEIRTAHALRPEHPTIIYYLAMGNAVNGNVDRANCLLRKVLTDDAVNYDIAHEGFKNIFASAGYENLLDYKAEMQKRVISSDTVLVIPDHELHIEGLAYDSLNKRILVSSINKRNVFVAEEGYIRPLFEKDFSLGITGIVPGDNILWFTASGFSASGIPENDPLLGTSILYKADLEHEILLDSFMLKDGMQHGFGDLIISREGEVLVSDSRSNIVYRLEENVLKEYIKSDDILSLQGLAQLNDYLFLADYSSGLYAYNRLTHSVKPVQTPENLSLKGIDGLYAYNDMLIAIQNGVHPNRVTALTLNEESDSIDGYRYLEKNHPAMGEPTLGFVAGNSLVYIANSFWGMNKNGLINNPNRILPVILKITLPEAGFVKPD